MAPINSWHSPWKRRGPRRLVKSAELAIPLRFSDPRFVHRIGRRIMRFVASRHHQQHHRVAGDTRSTVHSSFPSPARFLTAVGTAILVGLRTREIADRVAPVLRHAPPVRAISAGSREAEVRSSDRSHVSSAALQPDWLIRLQGLAKLRAHSRELVRTPERFTSRTDSTRHCCAT